LLIVLDTLNNCLGGEQKDTARFDENMNVKLLLREICQFIGNGMRFLYQKMEILIKWAAFIDSSHEAANCNEVKILASRVLFALSLNFFNAVFNRISARYEKLF
jgi:neurofibromin 1